jgi:methyl-accepting chemotaxis protein
MSIKRRIWALPVISTIIFGLGVAVSASIATGALNSIHMTESVDFPALGTSKALAAEIEGGHQRPARRRQRRRQGAHHPD